MSAPPPRPGRSYVNERGIVRVDYVKPNGDVYWVGWPYDGDRSGGICAITPVEKFRDQIARWGMDVVRCSTPWEVRSS